MVPGHRASGYPCSLCTVCRQTPSVGPRSGVWCLRGERLHEGNLLLKDNPQF